MNLALFYLWTFLGSLIFCTALILLGNALGAHLDAVLPLLHRGAYLLLGGCVVADRRGHRRDARSERVPSARQVNAAS